MINKRIGTITAGLFMIVLGALLLASVAIDINLGLTLMEFWPLFLISLGLEVLYHHYRARQEGKLRYDLASMLILFLFGLSAIGLFVFQMSGVGDLINELGKSSNYSIDISKENIPVDANIDRVVIQNNSGHICLVKIEERKNVDINGSVNVVAVNRTEARKLTEENKSFSTKRQGNSLIIRTHPVYFGKWFLKGLADTTPLTITVPAHLNTDITSNSNDISVIADKIEANLFVKQSSGSIDVTIPKNANADASVDAIQVSGHELKPVANPATNNTGGTSNSPNTTETAKNNAPTVVDEQQTKEYYAKIGNGGSTIRLINPTGTVGLYLK